MGAGTSSMAVLLLHIAHALLGSSFFAHALTVGGCKNSCNRHSSSFGMPASMRTLEARTQILPRIPSTSLAAAIVPSSTEDFITTDDSSSPQTFNDSPTETSTMIKRAAEVASVATLDVIFPLLSSFIEASLLNNENNQKVSSWDEFWSYTSKASNTTTAADLSNSNRVARALERLGPTYVKFGQALSSRGDIIPPPLAEALTSLQDRMEPFDTTLAKSIIRAELLKEAKLDESTVEQLLSTLSERPVAAASVGQVYRGYVDGFGNVAVKVQRPGVKQMVEKDAALLTAVAEFLESIPALPTIPSSTTDDSSSEAAAAAAAAAASGKIQSRFIETELVAGVQEFMSRIFEELDFQKEASNAERFASLYSDRGGSALKMLADRRGVVVPEILRNFCTTNVIVMEWIDGKKIAANDFDYASNTIDDDTSTDGSVVEEANEEKRRENLELIKMVIDITLNQLIDTGVMHADPHGGNLLKVDDNDDDELGDETSRKKRKKKSLQIEKKKIAYLDFGLLSEIDPQVSDALVCSISQLIFANDVEAVASLFGELQLIPDDVMNDPVEVAALTEDLRSVLKECLDYSDSSAASIVVVDGYEEKDGVEKLPIAETRVPKLKFDKLLDGLTRLIPRFRFRLPPYFINNARALGTLEGTARSLDPDFNVMTVLYPYALNRLIRNPSNSPVVDRAVQNLIRSEKTGRVDRLKLAKLLRDSAALTGQRKRRVVWDVLKTNKGRGLVLRVSAEEMHHRLLRGCFSRRRSTSSAKKERGGRRRHGRAIISDYLRL